MYYVAIKYTYLQLCAVHYLQVSSFVRQLNLALTNTHCVYFIRSVRTWSYDRTGFVSLYLCYL